MGLTIDDNIIDLGYNGGDQAPNYMGILVVLVTLIVLMLLLCVCFGKSEWFEPVVANAAGRAATQRTSLVALPYSKDNPYGANVRLTGVDQDMIGIAGNYADGFTVTMPNGKTYSDAAGEPGYVVPDEDGKYQSLNPDAPHYFPSRQDIANVYLAQGAAGRAAAASGMRLGEPSGSYYRDYKLGRVDFSDCPQLAELQAREANSAWDWMRTQAESGRSGQVHKPTEYFSNYVNVGSRGNSLDAATQQLYGIA